jgi:hypothetical protein
VAWAASSARWKVLRCGRRTGKDTGTLVMSIMGHGPETCPGPDRCVRAPHRPDEPCFRGILDGLDVVWIAPDYPQAGLIWAAEIEPRFRHKDNVDVNASERTVKFHGLGQLWIRSAETIDTVRGVGKFLAGVVVNEAAHLDLAYAWRQILRPALMDNRGWAILASTTNAGHDGNVTDLGDGKAAKVTPSYFNRLCEEIEAGKRGPEWEQFYGTAHDNPKMHPKEIAELISEYPADSLALQEEVYAKLLKARKGIVFSEFREDLHVVPPRFEVPNHWRWAAGLDFGFRAPGWFGLFACGPDGDIVCWDELYFKGLHAFEAGRQCGMKALQAKVALEYVACDEAMDQKTGAGLGPTIFEEFQKGFDAAYGGRSRGPRLIKTAKGPGSRAHRVQLTHHYLAYRIDEHGKVPPLWQPALKFHPRCANLIRTLPTLPYDAINIEDVDTTAEDHAYDGASYFLMSRPPKAHAWQERQDENTHPGMDFEHRTRKKRAYERDAEELGQKGFLPRGRMVEASE